MLAKLENRLKGAFVPISGMTVPALSTPGESSCKLIMRVGNSRESLNTTEILVLSFEIHLAYSFPEETLSV